MKISSDALVREKYEKIFRNPRQKVNISPSWSEIKMYLIMFDSIRDFHRIGSCIHT
jgi:hypothetical protein